jgi:hypothetical protein
VPESVEADQLTRMLDVDCATAAVPCGTEGAVVSGGTGAGGVAAVEPPEFEQAVSAAESASTVAPKKHLRAMPSLYRAGGNIDCCMASATAGPYSLSGNSLAGRLL